MAFHQIPEIRRRSTFWIDLTNLFFSYQNGNSNIYMNTSPWITKEYTYPITKNLRADITIIGGGISGLATAYFLLQETSATVSIIEMNTIGSGATGHNAGNVTADMEVSIIDAIKVYGEELTIRSYLEIFSAWDLFDEIIATIQQPVERIYMSEFYRSRESIIKNVLQTKIWHDHSISGIDRLIVSKNYPYLSELEPYADIFTLVDQKHMHEISGNNNYYLAVQNPAALVNSYEMTNEICVFLVNQYSSRFQVFQNTTVDLIRKDNQKILLDSSNGTFTSQKVILCTNGYKNLKFGAGMEQVDLTEILPTVSFVVGEITEEASDSYQKEYEYKANKLITDQFVYASSRKYANKTLKTFGGLDEFVSSIDGNTMMRKKEDLQKLYKNLNNSPINSDFSWHGIMGYTKNGLRKVGADSNIPSVLYNLGCNGSGILSGIWGGKRLTDIINQKELLPTLFD